MNSPSTQPHEVRRRPEGRLHCFRCRAAFLPEEAARSARFPCPGEHVVHGLRDSGQRQHIVYPSWSKDRSCQTWGCEEPGCKGGFHGPDPYCDWSGCQLCMHNCDCDVCEGAVTAPALCVLVDSHEGETPQEIKARKEKAFMELMEKLAGFGVGDYVSAVGVDTRGHDVRRTGTLLAKPKKVSAQRNGRRTPGWRLFVGLEGTDISTRSTWVTLFADQGFVERAAEPSGWTNGELRNVPGVRADNHTVRVLFGGKGGKRSTEPAEPRLAGVTYTGEGRYELWDVETREVLVNCSLQTRVWWAPAPKDQKQSPTAPEKEKVTSAAPKKPDNQAAGREIEEAAAERPAARPARRGLLYEGCLASDGTRAVLHLETGRVIGWLTPDLASFIPAVTQ